MFERQAFCPRDYSWEIFGQIYCFIVEYHGAIPSFHFSFILVRYFYQRRHPL